MIKVTLIISILNILALWLALTFTKINGNRYYNLEQYPENSGIWYDKGDFNHQYPQYTGALAGVDIYEDHGFY
ncbi:hypothetical protein vBKpnAMK6_00467 [Klebsiella phage vB_Kpn_AM_K6]